MPTDRVADIPVPTSVTPAPRPKAARASKTKLVAPSESAVPPDVTMALRTAPPSRGSGASRCIYFRDARQLAAIEMLRKHYPRASVSAIIQQLIDGFMQGLLTKPPESRTVTVRVEVHL